VFVRPGIFGFRFAGAGTRCIILRTEEEILCESESFKESFVLANCFSLLLSVQIFPLRGMSVFGVWPKRE
jgi:hypothetical protein